MNKILLRISWLLLAVVLMTLGCASDQVTGPNAPEEQPVSMELHFGVTNDQDYVPFAASTIYTVTGGSGVYSYELYRDGEFLGHDPIQILLFNEVRDYEITLKVRDAETDSVRTASVMVSGMQSPPGLPLEVTVYTADFFGIVPFTASVLGIAKGGKPPYSYEVLVDGAVLYEDDNVPVHITEGGDHEVLFRVTDAVGTTVQDGVSIYGHLPEEDPLMRINFVALPQTVEQGKYTGLITVVYGGQAPFDFEIRVDDQVVSYEPTYMYQVNFLGEKIAMVKVTDATGMSSEIGLSIFGVRPYIYVPPVTVDVTASPHEAQANEDISFHADVRGGSYDLIEWYMVGVDVEIGRGEDITRNFQTLGFEYVEARVYNWGNFLAADTVRVTITPSDDPKVPTVDATATPWTGIVPFYTTLHADVRDGTPPYNIIWYDDNGNIVGVDDLYRLVERPGEHLFEVRATDSLGLVGVDTVVVAGTSSDDPTLLVEVTGGPQGQFEPVLATLEAHASGGDGNYSYAWYWPTAATLFSTERFPITEALAAGAHTFICEVTDSSGATAIDDVMITVLETPGDNVVTWSQCPNLRVGPNDDFARTTTTVEVTGDYESFVQVEWDAVPSGELDAFMMEITRPDGHRYTWRVDKPRDWGRKTVYYEVGNVHLEQGDVVLNMYWLGNDKSGEKCTRWDTWQLISGNAIIPANKSTDVVVIRLDDPNRDSYITRQ